MWRQNKAGINFKTSQSAAVGLQNRDCNINEVMNAGIGRGVSEGGVEGGGGAVRSAGG